MRPHPLNWLRQRLGTDPPPLDFTGIKAPITGSRADHIHIDDITTLQGTRFSPKDRYEAMDKVRDRYSYDDPYIADPIKEHDRLMFPDRYNVRTGRGIHQAELDRRHQP